MINTLINFLTNRKLKTQAARNMREFAHIEFKYESPEYVEYLLNSGQIYKN